MCHFAASGSFFIPLSDSRSPNRLHRFACEESLKLSPDVFPSSVATCLHGDTDNQVAGTGSVSVCGLWGGPSPQPHRGPTNRSRATAGGLAGPERHTHVPATPAGSDPAPQGQSIHIPGSVQEPGIHSCTCHAHTRVPRVHHANTSHPRTHAHSTHAHAHAHLSHSFAHTCMCTTSI